MGVRPDPGVPIVFRAQRTTAAAEPVPVAALPAGYIQVDGQLLQRRLRRDHQQVRVVQTAPQRTAHRGGVRRADGQTVPKIFHRQVSQQRFGPGRLQFRLRSVVVVRGTSVCHLGSSLPWDRKNKSQRGATLSFVSFVFFFFIKIVLSLRAYY